MRRRYAYAALRVLRRGLAEAIERHLQLSEGPRRYNGTLEWERLRVATRRAFGLIEAKWGHVPFDDERSRP